MKETPQLHEMDPTGRFSDRVADYARYRPTYPLASAAAVIEGLGEPRTLRIADVGAGTGIFSRVMASTGAAVLAIEPNEQMRTAGAGDRGGEGLDIEWREGTAEGTGLTSASVDVVTCAQAFHWFRAAEALAEFARVLRPRGRVALVWNDRDLSDPVSAGYSRLIEVASDGHAAANDHTRPQSLYDSALFRDARELRFSHRQRLDLTGLIGRATSASYIPKHGSRLEDLKAGLTELFERYATDGTVELAYVTRVFLAEKA